jgi:hypothetical protein
LLMRPVHCFCVRMCVDTDGYPLPLTDVSKSLLRMSVFNDTLFLSNLEIVDYSIIVGLDNRSQKLIVGIIGQTARWDEGQANRPGNYTPIHSCSSVDPSSSQ